jgi:hypothetical protein
MSVFADRHNEARSLLWEIRAMFLEDVLRKLVVFKVAKFDMFRWRRCIGVHRTKRYAVRTKPWLCGCMR